MSQLRRWFELAGASASILCVAPLWAADWPEVPVPPRSELEMVLRDGRVNGLPTQIQRLQTPLGVQEVLQYYRQQWTRPERPEPRALNQAGWSALATWEGKRQVTVQVRPVEGGSEALLTQIDMGKAPQDAVPRELPRPAGTQVLQVTESQDGPKRSRLVSLVSDDGFDLHRQRWRQSWLRQGWAEGYSREQRGPDGELMWLATFERGKSSADQVLSYQPAQRRSFTTVNLMEMP